ncbi:MAG: hypothetical protein RKP20_17205, partial [Candidatus Competibacter sp.]|nr:hypothetical protein [Candidatus Competibacter sp.]
MALSKHKSFVIVSMLAAGAAAFACWPRDKTSVSERYRTQVVVGSGRYRPDHYRQRHAQQSRAAISSRATEWLPAKPV